jgi:hypothetical protein
MFNGMFGITHLNNAQARSITAGNVCGEKGRLHCRGRRAVLHHPGRSGGGSVHGQGIAGVSAWDHKGQPVYPRSLEWLPQGQANGIGPSNRSLYVTPRPGAPSRTDGAAAERRWANIMGEAHSPTVSERNRAATKAVGAGPHGRGGEAPELLRPYLLTVELNIKLTHLYGEMT